MTTVLSQSCSISPTMAVCLTGEKRWKLFTTLREKGLDVDFLECEWERPMPLLYLDLLHLAKLSLDFVELLQIWNCTICWGYRVDGLVTTEAVKEFLRVLSLSSREVTWWPNAHVLIYPRSDGELFRRLQAQKYPYTRQEPEEERALREGELIAQVYRLLDERRSEPLPQPEYMRSDSLFAYAFPLAWSSDNRWLLCHQTHELGRERLLAIQRKNAKEKSLISLWWLEHHGIDDASIVKGVAWSPDGKLIALAFDDDKTVIVRVGSHSIVQTLSVGAYDGTALAWSPDSQRLAIGDWVEDDPDFQGPVFAVQIWNRRTKTVGLTYKGHHCEGDQWGGARRRVRSLSWSADGTWLASADDVNVQVWNSFTGACQLVYAVHTDVVTTVQFNPCQPLIASTSHDGTLQIWQALTGELVWQCPLPDPMGFHERFYERRFAWSSDGAFLFFQNAEKHLVRLHLRTGHMTMLLNLHPSTLQDILLSPDEAYLALRIRDHTGWEEHDEGVFLWSLEHLLSLWL